MTRRAVLAVLSLLVAVGPPAAGAAAIAPLPAPAVTGALAMDDDVAEAIHLDGELNEEVWQRAPVLTNFLVREPQEGATPAFRTEVRLAYNAGGLYVAVRAWDDDPSKIVGQLTRRDAESASDWIRVLVDSYHDRRTAYEFAVNAAGVKQDRYWFNDSNSDSSWDAVWDVQVRRDGQGWRAEFRIPFSQLRFNPHGDGRFGFAVVRHVGRLNEISSWPLLAKSASGYVSSFGELTGVTLKQSPTRLEVVPYTVAHVDTHANQDRNPLVKSAALAASVGMDLRYALTPGLTLTATVNPDFGQVEADPAVVNLTAVETFFSEKRPFFIEGSGTFQFDVDCNDGACTGLFYSRRVGRSPHFDPDVPDGGYSTSPAQTTILGAAKLTGRVGAWSVGALSAATQEEGATIASGPDRWRQVVEPFTAYSVGRARREFANQSSVGLMLTSTNRRLDPGTPLVGSATTGGVDYDWRLGRRYAVRGYWAGSALRGSADAISDRQQGTVHSFQRPDATHLVLDEQRTSLVGDAGMVSLQKISGERMRFTSLYLFKSPGFDINDVGYQRRADARNTSNWVQFRFDRPGTYVRSYRLNLNQWAAWNYGGDRLWGGGNVNMHWVFTNNWRTGFGINVNPRGFDDRATRGGPGALGNDIVGGWWYVDGDDRRRLQPGWNSYFERDRYGYRYAEIEPKVALRPTTALSFQGGVKLTRNDNPSQWVEAVDAGRTHYVFGDLHQTQVALTARANYTITPNLSWQTYAAPFVSAGRYGGYKELVHGRADAYAARYQPFGYAGDADFKYLSFRTTNVLRWEFRPGSTLFVVWQQGREDDKGPEGGPFRFGRDIGHLFDVPASNVLLVKMAYWFNK